VDIVESKRAKDGNNGFYIAQNLEGFVRRKTIKQTVMTTVYGVTPYGAAKQIERRLNDLEEYTGSSEAGGKYLSKQTFESLNVLFAVSQKIQGWLTECADSISGDCAENVSWVTPLGLPVVQPYCTVNMRTERYGGEDSSNLFAHRKKVVGVKMKRQKHRNGFPPNFIHSLDGSHMMLTSCHMWSKGATFAMVHDCFWTHPCDVARPLRWCTTASGRTPVTWR